MNTHTHITAVILAGGKGTRLRSVVADRPKVLAEIHGRPFLSYLLDQVCQSQISQAVLCTGYLAEMVEDTFGRNFKNLSLKYSVETKVLGTGGALRAALSYVQTEYILVMNGDSFCNISLSKFIKWFFKQECQVGIALKEVADTKRFGSVQFSDNGKLSQFKEKSNSVGPGWINAGIYLLRTNLLKTIPANVEVSLEKDVFPLWLQSGIQGYQSGEQFLDIGTPESYAEASRFFASLK